MDLLLNDFGDGGEYQLNGSDIATDNTLKTAVYLSLFQGDNFYNIYVENKTDTSFEDALILPISKTNLNKVEITAGNLLNWLIQNEIANSVECHAYGDSNNKICVDIIVTEPNGIENRFSVIWQNEKIYFRTNKDG